MKTGFRFALVGKRAIIEPRSDTFIGATFHGDLLSIAAARTTIRLLRERDGIERTIAAGDEAVTEALAVIGKNEGLPYK